MPQTPDPGTDIKRVGKSGQISLGKIHTGQYFREQRLADGSILLTPVVVVDRADWTVRDQDSIRKALAWAAAHPAAETDLEGLAARSAPRAVRRARRPRP